MEKPKGKQGLKCRACGSNERVRAAWLLLSAFGHLRRGSKVAHFGPEQALASKLREVCDIGYEPFEIEIETGSLASSPAADPGRRRIDVTHGLAPLKAGDYDAVIHNHLLPKLACNYTVVLQNLHQLVKPGGLHIFSLPVYGGYNCEDLDPSIPAETRKKRFGRSEHYRRFGIKDFDRTIGMVFNISADSYRLDSLIDRDVLAKSAVPARRWSVSGGAVLVVRRTDG